MAARHRGNPFFRASNIQKLFRPLNTAYPASLRIGVGAPYPGWGLTTVAHRRELRSTLAASPLGASGLAVRAPGCEPEMNGVCAPEDGGDSLSVPLAPQFTVAGAMTGAEGAKPGVSLPWGL